MVHRYAHVADDIVHYNLINHLDDFYEFKEFEWSGTWSGNSYDFLKKEILPKFKGTADIIFTWEGGQMGETALRITDGKVQELNVTRTLSE